MPSHAWAQWLNLPSQKFRAIVRCLVYKVSPQIWGFVRSTCEKLTQAASPCQGAACALHRPQESSPFRGVIIKKPKHFIPFPSSRSASTSSHWAPSRPIVLFTTLSLGIKFSTDNNQVIPVMLGSRMDRLRTTHLNFLLGVTHEKCDIEVGTDGRPSLLGRSDAMGTTDSEELAHILSFKCDTFESYWPAGYLYISQLFLQRWSNNHRRPTGPSFIVPPRHCDPRS